MASQRAAPVVEHFVVKNILQDRTLAIFQQQQPTSSNSQSTAWWEAAGPCVVGERARRHTSALSFASSCTAKTSGVFLARRLSFATWGNKTNHFELRCSQEEQLYHSVYVGSWNRSAVGRRQAWVGSKGCFCPLHLQVDGGTRAASPLSKAKRSGEKFFCGANTLGVRLVPYKWGLCVRNTTTGQCRGGNPEWRQ